MQKEISDTIKLFQLPRLSSMGYRGWNENKFRWEESIFNTMNHCNKYWATSSFITSDSFKTGSLSKYVLAQVELITARTSLLGQWTAFLQGCCPCYVMSLFKLLSAIDFLEGKYVTQNKQGNPWVKSSLVDKLLRITKLDTTWPCAPAAHKPPVSGGVSLAVWTAGDGGDSAPLLNSLP